LHNNYPVVSQRSQHTPLKKIVIIDLFEVDLASTANVM
jgi:hypothetical protein